MGIDTKGVRNEWRYYFQNEPMMTYITGYVCDERIFNILRVFNTQYVNGFERLSYLYEAACDDLKSKNIQKIITLAKIPLARMLQKRYGFQLSTPFDQHWLKPSNLYEKNSLHAVYMEKDL